MFVKCKTIFSETFKPNLQNSLDSVWLDTPLWRKLNGTKTTNNTPFSYTQKFLAQVNRLHIVFFYLCPLWLKQSTQDIQTEEEDPAVVL